jgi:hypothetical protein
MMGRRLQAPRSSRACALQLQLLLLLASSPAAVQVFLQLWQQGFIQQAVQLPYADGVGSIITRAMLLSPTVTIIACKLFD